MNETIPVFGLSIILVVGVAVVGSILKPPQVEVEQASEGTYLSVRETRFLRNQSSPDSLEGSAHNVQDKTLQYAEIRARFYDEEGNLLGSGIDHTSDLQPKQRWKFRIPSVWENVRLVRYQEGSCYCY